MNYSCVLGDKSDALRLDEKEGGEWEYVNPPIRDNFRPDPSIRLNFFFSNPNPCHFKNFSWYMESSVVA